MMPCPWMARRRSSKAMPSNSSRIVYWKRCMYAAYGMRTMLQADGLEADIVYGDVACFAISPDARGAGWQGFANKGEGPAAHFWIETKGLLLDLGPHYLPAESSWPMAPIPLVRWPLSEALPKYLRYRERGRHAIHIAADPSLEARVAEFVMQCVKLRDSNVPVKMSSPTWQLTGTPSLFTAARLPGNTWARAALEVTMGRPIPPPPF